MKLLVKTVSLLLFATVNVLASSAYNFKIKSIDYVNLSGTQYFAIRVYGNNENWVGCTEVQKSKGGFLIPSDEPQYNKLIELLTNNIYSNKTLTIIGNGTYILNDKWEILSKVHTGYYNNPPSCEQ